MRKIIILLVLITVLSGCSMEVNLKINEENRVSQRIYLYEDIEKLGDYLPEEYVQEVYDFNDGAITSKGYNLVNKIDQEKAGMEFTKTDDNICEVFKNSNFKLFFNDINCDEGANYYDLVATGNYLVCGQECYDNRIYNVTLNIELPSKAIFSNANKVEGNTYTWEFKRDEESKLELKIKKNEIKNDSTIEKEERKKRSNNISVVILIVIILVISVIIKSLHNKYKNNKIEY